MQSAGTSRRYGFTLLEMLVVILITGLLASAATLTLLHSSESSTLNDALRRIEYVDSVTRHAARREGNRYMIVVDLDHGLITTRKLESETSDHGTEHTASDGFEDTTGDWVQRLRLPAGIHIDRMWVIDPALTAQDSSSNTQSENAHEEGVVSVSCSENGYTPTYGLELSGPNDQRRCMVMAGLTGQLCEGLDAGQLRSIFISSPNGPKS
jgi:prepilin-type N-terminal cleavage/methylation domain-containing protein